jgi:hypothetical protein
MDGRCSTHERAEKCIHIFMHKPEGRSRYGWEYNVKVGLKETL